MKGDSVAITMGPSLVVHMSESLLGRGWETLPAVQGVQKRVHLINIISHLSSLPLNFQR